jgi:hypothetical protein
MGKGERGKGGAAAIAGQPKKEQKYASDTYAYKTSSMTP